ncbi:uncharacterized protein [Scyliorhinus torazame]|uniref:uncharacterized protein isoform X1 n=1 Tax=Scyliorhinus torazame TaxID=75743 RepID=UPI003B5C853E
MMTLWISLLASMPQHKSWLPRRRSSGRPSGGVVAGGLNKPRFSVDSYVIADGESVTFNCSSSQDSPGIAFYLYRQGQSNSVNVKYPAAGMHSVTFTINKIDHSKIGYYTCRYEAEVNRTRLCSTSSDPLSISVRVSSSIPIRFSLAALIVLGIVIILGLEFIPTKRKPVPAGDDADAVYCETTM